MVELLTGGETVQGIRILVRLTIGLGVLSLAAVVLSQAALTDIYHGEADVTGEWRAVQASFVVIIGFHLAAIAMLWRNGRKGST